MTDDRIERQRHISLLDARKSLVTGDDGYVIFWPTSNVGAYTAYDLREIADELDKRNAAWDAIIQADPRIGGVHLEWVILGVRFKMVRNWYARLYKNGKPQKLASSRYAGRAYLVNILKGSGIPVRNPKPTPSEEKHL